MDRLSGSANLMIVSDLDYTMVKYNFDRGLTLNLLEMKCGEA